MRRKSSGGFSLIEIMIVMLVIAILFSIAVPNYLRGREEKEVCSGNLDRISVAKVNWAMSVNPGSRDEPSMEELSQYLTKRPVCPSGGTYKVGDMSIDPTCSMGASRSHTLNP